MKYTELRSCISFNEEFVYVGDQITFVNPESCSKDKSPLQYGRVLSIKAQLLKKKNDTSLHVKSWLIEIAAENEKIVIIKTPKRLIKETFFA